MKDNESRCSAALAQIADIAATARRDSSTRDYPSSDSGSHGAWASRDLACAIRVLPKRLWSKAAETAIKINPVNAPLAAPFGVTSELSVARLVVVTGKYWGSVSRRLTVSFMEATPSDLRARIIQHMNGWERTVGISFVPTSNTGQVRISRGAGGYWSYLGTDILHVPSDEPTMNLEAFTMGMPESEYKRVVTHETGHTLGFPHEHMRRALVSQIDPAKAYPYFLTTQGWDKQTVDEQVLTPLEERTIFGTPPDQDSIMCYQLPGTITYDDQPIRGGKDINARDYVFAGEIYPKPPSPVPSSSLAAQEFIGDWDESKDVLEPI